MYSVEYRFRKHTLVDRSIDRSTRMITTTNETALLQNRPLSGLAYGPFETYCIFYCDFFFWPSVFRINHHFHEIRLRQYVIIPLISAALNALLSVTDVDIVVVCKCIAVWTRTMRNSKGAVSLLSTVFALRAKVGGCCRHL